ncbi:MAG: NAD(P)H-dependent glycerol-3-phosphate dehydrogenase [Pseudomonadota bacterium]
MTSAEPAAPYRRLAVLGAGAWGTALACIAARAGGAPALWARDPAHAAEMAENRRNLRRLPEVALPDPVRPTADLAEAVAGAEAVLLATPSSAVRATARALYPLLPPGLPLILCAKGIEPGSGLLMSEAAAQELPFAAMAALSGPNFADEAALGHPTACVIASDCGPLFATAPAQTVAARLALALRTDTFRPYISDDLVGVQIGGALKNVIAIACGVAAGAGFGENTRAALITRGLHEMQRLSEALGARRETVTGLAGIGDLTLTCTSQHSRNMSLGLQLGRGLPREACFEGREVVVEGERAALSVTDLARRRGVELPICETVRAILHEDRPLRDAVAALLSRPLKAEPPGLDFEIRPA